MKAGLMMADDKKINIIFHPTGSINIVSFLEHLNGVIIWTKTMTK